MHAGPGRLVRTPFNTFVKLERAFEEQEETAHNQDKIAARENQRAQMHYRLGQFDEP